MKTNAFEDSISDDDYLCILVEGPRWADAAFYGKWLLVAAKAHALCEKAGFKGLNVAATGMLANLWRDRVAVKVCSSDRIFIMMIEMGLFVRTGQRYQMDPRRGDHGQGQKICA